MPVGLLVDTVCHANVAVVVEKLRVTQGLHAKLQIRMSEQTIEHKQKMKTYSKTRQTLLMKLSTHSRHGKTDKNEHFRQRLDRCDFDRF